MSPPGSHRQDTAEELSSDASVTRTPRVAVIGAGVSGVCTAVALVEAGITDFVVYEKSDQVGGVWRDNTYPGVACDTPSRYYAFSFAPNPDWTHLFSAGDEIQSYLQQVAHTFGVDGAVRFGTEVAETTWTAQGRWCVRTTAGDEDTFDFVVAATGVLHHPNVPAIDGADSFEGAAFHSARWDHSVALDGRRVAVIGNGSTGVQLTRTLAARCASFMLFQRTPQWLLPTSNPGYRAWTRGVLQRSAVVNRAWSRLAHRFWQTQFELIAEGWTRPGWIRDVVGLVTRAHLRVVRDPDLRERLRPTDLPGCKRLVLGGGFYQAFNAGDAELVDTPIDHVEPRGIVTSDGVLHEADVIIFATGFEAQSYLRPIELVGPDGLRLSDVWGERPTSYDTVALPGFPNFFLLSGPHSPIGNQVIPVIAETQVAYVMQWIDAWRKGLFDSAAPTLGAAAAFTDEMAGAFSDTVWVTGCDSYYLAQDGTPLVWPYSARQHRQLLAEPVIDDWHLAHARASQESSAPVGDGTPNGG